MATKLNAPPLARRRSLLSLPHSRSTFVSAQPSLSRPPPLPFVRSPPPFSLFSHSLLPSNPTASLNTSRLYRVRCRVNRSGNYFLLNSGGSGFSVRPPTEMAALFPGCDYNHWLIVKDKPGGEGATEQQMIDCYIQALAKVLGSEEEATKKIYKVSCERYFGFGCEIDEDTSMKLEGLPCVLFVLPDSYVDAEDKDYEALFGNRPPKMATLPAPTSQSSLDAELVEHLKFKESKAVISHIGANVAHAGFSPAHISQPQSFSRYWFLDSGATEHISGNISLFSSISYPKDLPAITLVDGSQVSAEGIGDVQPIPGLFVSSVLYIPNCPYNLLSVHKLVRQLDCHITFSPSSVLLLDRSSGREICCGSEHRGLYYLQEHSTICTADVLPLHLHRSFGHPNISTMQRFPDLWSLVSPDCESCRLGKDIRVPYQSSDNNKATAPFELVYFDVWGPSRSMSKDGYLYFVTFIDDFSRYTWIYLMKNCSELLKIFHSFYLEISTQYGARCPNTPQQNGVAEHKNRHIIETARTLLLDMQVPYKFWDNAVLTSCYLINRMPSSVLSHRIPYSLLFPDHSPFSPLLHPFGCVCVVHSQFSGNDVKCIFLGYSRVQCGYICYSPALDRRFISTDVTFFDFSPYFSPCESRCSELRQVLLVLYLSVPPPVFSPSLAPVVMDRHLQVYSRWSRSLTTNAIDTVIHSMPFSPLLLTPAPSSLAPTKDLPHAPPETGDVVPFREKRSARNPYPIYSFLSYHRSAPSYTVFVSSLSFVFIFCNVIEALASPVWCQALVEEMTALDSIGSRELYQLPLEKFTVGCRWVYVSKVGSNRKIDRLKAWLMVNDFTQIYGFDYDDTFSLVAKMTFFRPFPSLAVMHHWPLNQLDIKNIFLNDDLQEDVVMEQPLGFVALEECVTCRSLFMASNNHSRPDLVDSA